MYATKHIGQEKRKLKGVVREVRNEIRNIRYDIDCRRSVDFRVAGILLTSGEV